MANALLDQTIRERLDRYVENMRPGRPLEPNEAASQQLLLWNLIRTILNAPADEFGGYLNILLAKIQEHRQGVFSERYVFRALQDMKVVAPERRNFERLLNLFLQTADPRSRYITIKQINLDSTLSGLPNDTMRQKILGFYQQNG